MNKLPSFYKKKRLVRPCANSKILYRYKKLIMRQ